ncbi:hypothetical protein [Dyadobacter psychrotolerans]|uniref:Outer membrane protein beta-barrel domain-containing protein n=1 Tax=Dyadobacter psychrotolerans TaxID=2541721 RepID=A0A4V2Z2J4_9BACT|nr:hypothetical protein [Dyadobacter psychrotolerans]TDE08068.1 hypothetical protein E0F88_33185 [Dyadobacter psychrotolerans]
MKNFILLSLFSLNICGFSMAQSGQEKVLSISLNRSAQFRSLIGDTYEIEQDTVFNSVPGFKVHAYWEEKKFLPDTTTYLILTYPNFFVATSGQNNQKNKITRNSFTGLSRNGFQLDAMESLSLNPDSTVKMSLPMFPEPKIRTSIIGINGKNLIITKKDFFAIPRDTVFATGYSGIATGQLTLPFKFRPGVRHDGDKTPFAMSTDVTIGAYAGPRYRISKRQNYYIVLPLTLGLSFININENSTSSSGNTDVKAGIYPGITGAAGAIVQIGTFTVGLVAGLDWVSQVGNSWIYQSKPWASFAIGYSFLK